LYKIKHDPFKVTGFPFALRAEITNLSCECEYTKEYWKMGPLEVKSIQFPKSLRLSTYIWNPNDIAFETEGLTVSISGGESHASLIKGHVNAQSIQPYDVRLSGVKSSSSGLKDAHIHIAAKDDRSFTFRLETPSVYFFKALKNDDPFVLDFAVSYKGPDPDFKVPLPQMVRQLYEAKARLILDHLSVKVPLYTLSLAQPGGGPEAHSIHFDLSASLALDAQLQPLVDGTLKAYNPSPKSWDSKLIKVMESVAVKSADGKSSVATLPVKTEKGQLTIGGVPLDKLPSFDWASLGESIMWKGWSAHWAQEQAFKKEFTQGQP
jgi:hypothetical protein